MGHTTRLKGMGNVHGSHVAGTGKDHAHLVMSLEVRVPGPVLGALIID